MNSALSLTLILMGSSCLYLFAVAYSFRLSHKRSFSPPWLLLPLFGAAITGITLVFSVPVLPASTIPVRLLELLAHLFNILLIWIITSKIAPERRLPATLLYAWNPLVLIELTVYANNAGVVIFLLLLALATLLVSVPFSPVFRRGGGGADVGRGRLRRPHPSPTPGIAPSMGDGGRRKRPLPASTPPPPLQTIAALVLIGLAVRINFMTLLLAPLWLWFMARQRRGVGRALMGFAWRALVVLVVFFVAYLPAWQGSTTFLAITDALNLFNFANSPLSLVVMPARSLFKFVAQNGHFPPSLMQPATAADMTILATSLFLFALLYLREMGRVRARLRNNHPPRPVGTRGGRRGGWGPCACPAGNMIRTGSHDSQQIADKGTERGMPEESQWDEDKHKAPPSAPPHPLSLQDDADDPTCSYAYDTLFTGWAVVFLGYMVLAVTVFWPGYIVWGVWIVTLRRFDALSVCTLLLSCSALLYYPLQQFASHSTGILLPVCVFGIPLVYLVVQHYIPPHRVERKNVLT